MFTAAWSFLPVRGSHCQVGCFEAEVEAVAIGRGSVLVGGTGSNFSFVFQHNMSTTNYLLCEGDRCARRDGEYKQACLARKNIHLEYSYDNAMMLN